MPTIDLPQGRIHYRVTGPETSSAPPVVFVHGLLVNAELWTPVADLLATQGIRSYAPDLPLGSHPEAVQADADLSPRGVARLLLEFLTALDLDDVTLVGNDTGGALCQFLIDTDASRIGRLVLTNCDAFEQFPPAPFTLLVKIGRRPGRLRAAVQPVRLTPLRHSMLGYGPLVSHPDAALTRRWVTPLLTDAAVRQNTARFMRGIDPAELVAVGERLHRFGKPVRLVWGTRDRFFTLELAHRLRDAFGTAELVEVDGARTFVALDAPELLAREVAAIATTAR